MTGLKSIWVTVALSPCLWHMPLPAQELLDPPRFTNFVCPTYPQMGNQVHIQGVVRIEIALAKSGEPTQIRVLAGHPMLMSATVEAAKQWRFQPYRLNGKAVEVSMRVDVIFALKPRSGYRCRIKLPPAAVKILGVQWECRIP